MIKVLFNDCKDFCEDSKDFHEVGFDRVGHVVTLKGITEQNTSGFTTWRMDGVTQLGDFSGFTTVYRICDDFVQYSDDGSVWTEPEYPEPVPVGTLEKRVENVEGKTAELEESLDILLSGVTADE